MTRRTVLLLGIHGAGKTTVGQALARSHGAGFLGAGHMLRRARQGDGPLAATIDNRLSRGLGVPTAVSYPMLREALDRQGDTKLIVLDGYPRTESEIPLLEETLRGPPELVLRLDLDRVLAVDRVLTRRVCDPCGLSYGPAVPPRRAGLCDACGEPLTRRQDDNPKALGARLETFDAEGAAIAASYHDRGLLRSINATQVPSAVIRDVIACIGEPPN